MSDYCVVATNGAHARFFTLEEVDFPELESGPKLIDRGELINQEKKSAGRDLFTDSKTGRGRAPRGGPSHGYDDHRLQHEDEFDRRFARKVLEKASGLARTNQARRVVLVAPARVLGLFRQDLDIVLKHGMEIRELPKDMTKFSPGQIHDHLAKHQLVPARRKPETHTT